MLYHTSLHAAVLNTAALRESHLADGQSDPPGGAFGRDAVAPVPAREWRWAVDAMTYSTASLAGPALAALIAAGAGARSAVIVAAALVGLAVPAACSLRVSRSS